MKPLILAATNRTIQVKMSGAAATTNPKWTSHWGDHDSTSFVEDSSAGNLNGTTGVDVVAAPSSGKRRIINEITIANVDTAPVTITVYFNDNGTLIQLYHLSLVVNGTFTLEGVFDANGSLQTAVPVVSAASISGTISTAQGGTGIDTSALTGALEIVAGVWSVISKITLALGGTGADLSATGAGFLKQASMGAAITVAALTDGDLPGALAGHTITGGTINNTPIGATTPSTGYFSALRLKIGGFFGIFTHANSADRTYTLPDYDGTMATLAGTEAFTNKTLTSPAINTPTVSGGTIDNTPIGTTTRALGYFSALREYIGGFAAIFTHANTADRTYTLPDFNGTLATLSGTEVFANKTLTTPTVASLTNMQHNHQNAAGGGSLDMAAIGSGTLGLARGGTNSDNTAVGAGKFFGNNAVSAGNGSFVIPPDQSNVVPNSSFEVWERGITSVPDGWTLNGASATVAKELTIIKHGLASAKLTRSGTDCHLSADVAALAGKTYIQSRVYTFGAWVYATVASRVRLRVNDGTTTSNSSYHSGGSAWEYLTVTFTVAGGATALNVGLAVDTGDTSGYLDGATLVEGAAAGNYTPDVRSFNQFPKRATMWHDEATVVTGNALAYAVNTGNMFNGSSDQSASANGDTFTHSFWLAAGTYTLSVLGIKTAGSAKIDWYIDNVAVISGQDWYNSTPAVNTVQTGSVTVLGDGEHILKGVIAGRNGSNSTGFSMFLDKYWLKPSTD